MNFILVCLVTLLLTGASPAQTHDPLLQPEKLREDFHVFRLALEEGDSGLYRYVNKPALDQVFDQTEARLNRPMTVLEFYRVIAPAMAAVECGHNNIKLSKDLQEQVAKNTPLLPVEVRILDNKVYVFRDYSSHGLEGAELTKINGVPTEKILSTIYGSMSGDGVVPTMKPWRLGHSRNFSKLLYIVAAVQSPFHLEYLDRSQSHKKMDLSGTELPNMPINSTDRQTELSWERKDKYDLANFSFVDNDKIGILDIYSFEGEYADAKHTIRMPDFIDGAFKQLHEKGSSALIVDLRNNGGGEDEDGERLFSYLATDPYHYYDDLVVNRRKFSFVQYIPAAFERAEVPADKVKLRPDGKFSMIDHANLGLHQPRQPHFGGKVYILMNGGSFSTTAEFLSTANYHNVAKFIGEEEGGAYFGNTSGWDLHVVLPNSGLIFTLRPLTYYLSVKGDHAPDRGVMPDFPVKYSIADLLSGKDNEMELALRLARSKNNEANPPAGH